jgi:hypothetical protein
LEVLDFIVCDDIRQEIGGKLTLVGVYDDLNVHVHNLKDFKPPINLPRLGFLLRVFNTNKDFSADTITFQILFNNEMINSLSAPANFEQGKDFINIFLVSQNFPITGNGDLNLKIVFLKDNRVVEEVTPIKPLKVTLIEKPE